MRIAYDPQTFYHQKYGGISRYFVELAKELVQRGNEVGVFAPLGNNAYLTGSGLEAMEASHLAKIYQHLPHLIRPAIHAFGFPPIRWEIKSRIGKWKPTIVHETYFHDVKLYPSGIGTVVTVYDMIHEIYPDLFPSWDPTSRCKRKAVDWADAVICISHSTAHDLKRLFGVPDSKIFVTHLGWESLNEAAPLAPTGIDPDKPYFLYVGSRFGYKNFSELLEAFAGCPELRRDFQIVAFGGGEFNESEREKIKVLGLARMVRQISGGDAVLNYLYIHALALVYPSQYEGFGLPPLEAMGHDCPVVSSNTSSMPEVIGEAALFFSPGISGELGEALCHVATSERIRADLIARGRIRVHKFSWAKCARQTEAVYKHVIDQRKLLNEKRR